MPHSYAAENHDWDVTLRAAWSLVMIGQAAQSIPTGGNLKEREFANYTGSMLLSFCAIESFSASLAFSMPRDERFCSFNFEKYTQTKRFWEKMELLCSAIPYQIDKSHGVFQTIAEMQRWRNLVTHATPYRIEPTVISDAQREPTRLHRQFHGKQYTRKANLESAQKFYLCAFEYIELLQELTGITPRSVAQYTVGSDDHQS